MKTLLLVLGLAFAGPTFAAQLNSPHFTVDGGGTSAATGGRFRLEATVGKPGAGTLASLGVLGDPDGRFTLRGGFHWPGHSLRIGFKDGLVVVSWETGVGDNTKPVSAVLEYTNELHTDPAANIWTPLALAPEARSASFPIASAPRFFRLREK